MKKPFWWIILLVLVLPLVLSACTVNQVPTDAKLAFNTLTVNGDNVSGHVPNNVTSFSFLKEIELQGEAEYSVSFDIFGKDVIPTKTVSLQEGNNTFYVLATLNDSIILYTVTIRRNPIYDVVFNTNGGTVIQSQTIEEGEHVIIPDQPTKDGYTFIGWDYTFEDAITDNTVINAQWAANTYEITYDSNGGSVVNSKQTVNYGESYVLETPTRMGYTFAGWYDGDVRYRNGVWKIPNDITLTAMWDIDTYHIRYENNGGIHSNPNRYTVEDEIELTAPTKTGYTFMGWTYEGQPTPVLNVKISKGSIADKYFTANWAINTYEIIYDANGGSVVNSKQTVNYGESYVLETPTRIGYTFAGWYDGDVRYRNGVWKTLNDITLTAKWDINRYYVSVSSTIGGSVTGEGLYDYNSTVTVTATSKLGYTWLGWYDADDNMLSDQRTYTFTIQDTHISLYGKWKISDDIADFSFSSTETTCTITDVVDDSKSIYIIPDYVTNIGDWAFFMCDYLTSIVIPNGVTSIGGHAFSGCNRLSRIQIPNSVTSIGESAFSGCDSLTSISIPENVTHISEYAFSSCDNLTSVIIHANVTFIGKNAFSGCTKLESITFRGNISTWNTIVLGNDWNFMVPATSVICSNGVVILS